jgi:hypothetical protein
MPTTIKGHNPDEIKGLIRKARAAQLDTNWYTQAARIQDLCDLLVETANALEDLQWRLDLSQRDEDY